MTALDDPVVLLDENREPVGEQRKSLVHHSKTPLHLAFSLYLFDSRDRILMTRRALGKLTWPGVWTNTCCGHPLPGETPEEAVTRRLHAELGLEVGRLDLVLPDFAYCARDVSGIWENEVCPVYVGRAISGVQTPRPDPAEAMDWIWVEWQELVAGAAATPFAFSPWAVSQIGEMAEPGVSPIRRAESKGDVA